MHAVINNMGPGRVIGLESDRRAVILVNSPKASKRERNEGCKEFDIPEYRWNNGGEMKQIKGQKGNFHPTVKPVQLMAWLVRLVTPPEGVCLDPFMGSGTTGVACKKLKRNFIGIEREPEYMKIAEARINGTEEVLL